MHREKMGTGIVVPFIGNCGSFYRNRCAEQLPSLRIIYFEPVVFVQFLFPMAGVGYFGRGRFLHFQRKRVRPAASPLARIAGPVRDPDIQHRRICCERLVFQIHLQFLDPIRLGRFFPSADRRIPFVEIFESRFTYQNRRNVRNGNRRIFRNISEQILVPVSEQDSCDTAFRVLFQPHPIAVFRNGIVFRPTLLPGFPARVLAGHVESQAHDFQ